MITRSVHDTWLNYSIIAWCNFFCQNLTIGTLDSLYGSTTNMNATSLTTLLAVFVVCSFCDKDFKSLGRHQWRCKHRVSGQHRASVNTPLLQPDLNNADSTCNTGIVKCFCGKVCKGIRGLKTHQRRCRAIVGLHGNLYEELEEDVASNEDIVEQQPTEPGGVEIKPGIRLPKSDNEWQTANEYFRAHLGGVEIDSQNIESVVENLNTKIYNYFERTCGLVGKECHSDLQAKYDCYSVKELKKQWKSLKLSNAAVSGIQFASHLLRTRISKAEKELHRRSSDDNYICNNFWGYVKATFQSSNSPSPQFSKQQCTDFFTEVFSAISPGKIFNLPDWIPTFNKPESAFDLTPPSYQQITQIIRRMKASGSPCPLDKISRICFKRCPYLRSKLSEIIRFIWISKKVPAFWKRACTVLVYKKGSPDDPSNSRPISLQSVPLKIFTSCIRDTIYDFLKRNNYIEHAIQKGFTSKLSGTLEHTAQMAYMINKARVKQRSLIITLLDLKNAFGEVHHRLIQRILDYHYIPDEVQQLIDSLYQDFYTSIISKDFTTPFIPVRRGVLQGGCLSPLLFNMCFNSFIQLIKSDSYKQLGFSPVNERGAMFNPVHWCQFADDAAVISTNEKENHLLLNCFTRWCQWANMIVRVDKCSTFGIKKLSTKSLQFTPNLLINNQIIPAVKIGEPFRYLGRYFDYEMSNKQHQLDAKATLTDLLQQIDLLNIHPKSKLYFIKNTFCLNCLGTSQLQISQKHG